MPDFWEYPTVSMGLGPINSIYQARFNRYLHHRQLDDTSGSRVWCFIGDGETDEPETLGAISLAGREGLDNLIWVVNCNLQRLDGPVRGNGKIIQELEARVPRRGLERHQGDLGLGVGRAARATTSTACCSTKMNETVDGEFQRYTVEDGAYIREHFFGPDPRLRKMVEHLSDDELRWLPRGGHDYRKLYAAYKAATEQRGAPTVILAKTIKGWTLGTEVEGRNATHQIKKMTNEQLRVLRDAAPPRGGDPRGGAGRRRRAAVLPAGRRLARCTTYLMDRRRALGGSLPKRVVRTTAAAHAARRTRCSTSSAAARARRRRPPPPPSPACCAPSPATRASARGWCRSSPTRPAPSAWTRCSRSSASTPPRARSTSRSTTSCCSPTRSRSTASSSRRASPRPAPWRRGPRRPPSYATRGVPMVPFFIFYSMFGFQRVGDLIWAAADARARGFLLGATAGRTTLLGEGLQHQDGHSLVLASTVPTCEAYDPAFAYETAEIIRRGIERMYGARARGRLLLPHPLQRELRHAADGPTASAEGIIEGLYRWQPAPDGDRRAAGPRSCSRARPRAPPARPQAELAERWGVGAELWSATSYKRLREEAMAVERWNRLHPGRGAAHAPGHRAARRVRRARSWPSPTSCGRCPTRSPAGSPRAAATPRSAPTASAAPTPARRCAASSRSTPPTWWSPCSSALAADGAGRRRRRSPRPSPTTASTPTTAAPWAP